MGRKGFDDCFPLDPNFWLPHLFVVRVYLAAIASAESAATLSGGNAEATATIAFSMAQAGRNDEARKIPDQLLERSRNRYVSRYAVARIYLALGDNYEAAINEL